MEHLSPERLAEVDDFIDFLQQRDQDKSLRKDFAGHLKRLLPRYGITTKMPSTMPYGFGNGVLVAFPFTSLQTTKKRPAIVISCIAYQRTRRDIVPKATLRHD